MLVILDRTFVSSRVGAVVAAVACASTAAAQNSLIGVELLGPAGDVVVGSTIDVKVRLKREPVDTALPQGTSFAAFDLVLQWNPSHLKLMGLSATGAVPLLASYFPTPAVDYTGLNEVVPPQDGNGLYYALAPLGNPTQVPIEGVLVTTLKFKVLAPFAQTEVVVLPDFTVDVFAETIVWDGTMRGLDVTGTLTNALVHQFVECTSDLDGNGVVEGSDVAVLLGAWGTGASAADVNDDGVVNGYDLAIVLGDWGACPGT